MATSHLDPSVAIDLTGNPACDIGVILGMVSCNFLQLTRVSTLTLTATIDAVANQTTSDFYLGILIDVAVLTTTEYRACDATLSSC